MAKNRLRRSLSLSVVACLLVLNQLGCSGLSLSLTAFIHKDTCDHKEAADTGQSVLDDTFRRVSDVMAEQDQQSAQSSLNQTDSGSATKTPAPLVLAQTRTHIERVDRNQRAVRVIQSYDSDIARTVESMFTDGYWVIVCE